MSIAIDKTPLTNPIPADRLIKLLSEGMTLQQATAIGGYQIEGELETVQQKLNTMKQFGLLEDFVRAGGRIRANIPAETLSQIGQ